jgi:hypothetical protein
LELRLLLLLGLLRHHLAFLILVLLLLELVQQGQRVIQLGNHLRGSSHLCVNWVLYQSAHFLIHLHHSIISLTLTFNFIVIHDFLLNIGLMLHELMLLLLSLLLAINNVLEK